MNVTNNPEASPIGASGQKQLGEILLVILLFYAILHLFVIPPFIHPETGMAMLLANVKFGEGIQNGDPWWSMPPEEVSFAPALRLWLFFHLQRLFSSPHNMAAVMSTIYALLAAAAWWLFWMRSGLFQFSHPYFVFLIILPFSYDLWTVGLSQGFKDISFWVIFFPLIMLKTLECIRENKIGDVIKLGLLSSLYFVLHSSIGIVFLEIPFCILLLYSPQGSRLRNVLIFSLALLPLAIGPLTTMLSGAGLSTALDYPRFKELIKLRFSVIFPEASALTFGHIPFLASKLGVRESNFLFILMGVVSFVFYWLASHVNTSSTKPLKVGAMFNILSCSFLGFPRLSIIASLGWLLRYQKMESRHIAWFAFFPNLLMPLAFSMMAIWAGLAEALQRPLIDQQFVLAKLTIPWGVLGAWFLAEEILIRLSSPIAKHFFSLFSFCFFFLWFWFPLVGYQVYFREMAFAGIFVLLYQFLEKASSLHLLSSFSERELRFLKVQSLLIIIFYLLSGGQFERSLLRNTPFYTQFQISKFDSELVKKITEFVPENKQILTGPYFIRYLTKRPVYCVTKDVNIWYSNRNVSKLEEVGQKLTPMQKAINSDNPKDLVSFMRSTSSDYIVLSHPKEDPELHELYSSERYHLYQLASTKDLN